MTTENLCFNLFEIFDNMMGTKKKLYITKNLDVYYPQGRHTPSNPRSLGSRQDRRKTSQGLPQAWESLFLPLL